MVKKEEEFDEFQASIHALHAVNQAKRRAAREHRRQVPEDLALRGPAPAHGERRLPEDRRCPVCQRVRLTPRSWVLTGLAGVAPGEPCCRSCAFRAAHGRPPRHVEMPGSSQADLEGAREPLATQEYFADLCGWSQARQSHLEGAVAMHRVRGRTALKICLAFLELEAEPEEVPAFLRALFRYVLLMRDAAGDEDAGEVKDS